MAEPVSRLGRGPSERHGFAYIAVLVLVMLMSTMGISFVFRAGIEASATIGRASNMQAHYLAEAGANHALWRLLNEGSFPASAVTYYMHSLGGGRYGYKVRRHTDTTFATIAVVGAIGDSVVHQSYVVYIPPLPVVAYAVYAPDGTNIPKYRRFDGFGWFPELDTLDVGGEARWVEAESSPVLNEDEMVMGTLDEFDDINLAVWGGTFWGNLLEFSTDARKDLKCFDIAYESLSGEVLIVGRSGANGSTEFTLWGHAPAFTPIDVDLNFNGAQSVFVADMDGDGDRDILGAGADGDNIFWWENTDGTGTTWVAHTVDASFGDAWSVVAADIDGDTDLDVVATGHSADDVTWWENMDGTGTAWAEHTIEGSLNGALSVHVVDLDGDTDLDVVTTSDIAKDLTWWENTDGVGGAWAEHLIDGNLNKPQSVQSGDIDGDMDLDLIVTVYNADDVSWWENTDGAGGGWIEHIIDGGFDGASWAVAADMDGDGDLDVVGASERDDEITWWENTAGDGTAWTTHAVSTTFNGARSVYIVDMDGDTDLDIVGAAEAGDAVSWWKNEDGVGGSWTEKPVAIGVNGVYSVVVADITGDGRPDVIGAARIADDILVWEQDVAPTKSWVHDPPAVAFNKGILRYVDLIPNPLSDEILVVFITVPSESGFLNPTTRLYRWDGDTFSDLGNLDNFPPSSSQASVNVAYESLSGDAVIVWGRILDFTPNYRTWDGTTLSAQGNLPNFGGSSRIVRMASDPTSDQILVAALDLWNDINIALWDGSAWVDSRQIEGSTSHNDRQSFDVAWEDDGTEAIVTWSRAGTDVAKYFYWTKGTALAAGTIQDGPDFQNNMSTVRAMAALGSDDIVLLSINDAFDLQVSLADDGVFQDDPPILLNDTLHVRDHMAFDVVPKPGAAP